MRLSQHFELKEFLRSEYASRKGIVMLPDSAQVERLRWLCNHILEPIRTALCKPIRINSGYRTPAVNTAVGGSPSSAHMHGRAADIEVYGMSNLALAQFIRKMNLEQLDKLILEFPSILDPTAGWVHVQIAKLGEFPRMEYLTAKRTEGKTEYIRGLTA